MNSRSDGADSSGSTSDSEDSWDGEMNPFDIIPSIVDSQSQQPSNGNGIMANSSQRSSNRSIQQNFSYASDDQPNDSNGSISTSAPAHRNPLIRGSPLTQPLSGDELASLTSQERTIRLNGYSFGNGG